MKGLTLSRETIGADLVAGAVNAVTSIPDSMARAENTRQVKTGNMICGIGRLSFTRPSDRWYNERRCTPGNKTDRAS